MNIKDLNAYDRLLIINGCKPEWFPDVINVDFIFNCDCNQHDIEYWQGGSEQERKESDKRFLKNMKSRINDSKLGWFKKWTMRRIANSYYKLVRKFGNGTFQYRYQKFSDKIVPMILDVMDLPSYSTQLDYRFISGEFNNVQVKQIGNRWYLEKEL